jgi:hypothetical protein
MTPTTVMSAYAASKVPSLGRIVPLLLVLTMLIASTSGFYLTPPQIMPTDASLKAEPTVNSASEATLYDYSLYLASPNGTAGGDGYMTTQVPVSGGQDEEDTADKDVYFNSPEMLEDLSIKGRPQHGSANGFYLPATLFIKSTGPDGASAHWRIFLLDENTVVAQDDWETTVCTPTFLSSCSYAERNFQLKWSGTGNAADIINVSSGDQLRLQVRADIDCQSDPPDPNPDGGDAGTGTEGRQTTPNSDCTASIAFNEIDDASNRFSFIDIEANALKQSIITVQRSGSGAGDTEPVTEWFPNDVLSERAMQFRFHVTSSFGRFDINNVRLTVKSPSGDYVLDDQIDASWKDVDDTPWGLFGTGLWTYPGGLESGEYVVKIVVDDIQGNSISIDHPNLQMRRYGVALRHGEGRNVEYIAPSQQTSIPLQLHHRGSISEELEVELKLLTNLGSAWFHEFDRDDRYALDRGGAVINPILTLRAPSDLTGSPNALEILATAKAIVEGTETVVHEDVLYLSLEKIDVYAPPMVSIWDGNHSIQLANSSRPDSFDTSIPRYVEHDSFTTFLVEIFNTGFDSDTFRLDVLERSKSIIQVYDNDTGLRILEDDGDGTFHTAELSRHTTQILRLHVKPSSNRNDPDIGLIGLELVSTGNGTYRSQAEFTIQRTFGIRASVVQDCDGVPLGMVSDDACLSSGETTMSMRVKITNSATIGTASTWWRIINPADLPANNASNPRLVQWDYRLTDVGGDGVGRVSLAPQESVELFLEITPKQEVEMGNHTILLRIEEDSNDFEKAYFDLPIIVQVGSDEPSLRVVQVSRSQSMEPGETREVQMKLHNDGNSPLLVLLTATISESSWAAEVIGPAGSPLIEIGAFDEASFTLRVTAPADANSGTSIPVAVSAEPYGTNRSFEDEHIANLDVSVSIEITSISMRLMNEIQHPRLTTGLFGVGALLLFVAAIQNRINRRRWALHQEQQELLIPEEESLDELFSEKVRDEPSPADEAEDSMSMQDDFEDDIELIDFDDD